MELNKKIYSIVNQIVNIASPRKVILFGSAARGEWGQDSDLDFLVVLPDGASMRQTAKSIYMNVESEGIPFDVIVITEARFENNKDNIGLIYKTAIEEGKTLYAA